VGVDQFVVDRCQDICSLFIHRSFKTFKTGLFGDFFGNILKDEKIIFFWKRKIIAGFEGRIKPLVEYSRDLVSISKEPDPSDNIRNIYFHGADIFTLSAHGADPWPAGLHQPFLETEPYHADKLARIKSFHSRHRAGAGTNTACRTDILGKRPRFETIMIQMLEIDDIG
jgi:hypothetical protein